MKKNTPLYEVRKIHDLKDMLSQSISLYGDKTLFLIKEENGKPYKPISFNEYNDDVNAFGTALIDLGLKGGRIAIIGRNRYEWYVSYMSAVNGVGVVVPLDKELPPSEIKNLITRSKVDAVIFSDEKKDDIEAIRQDLSSVKFYISMDLKEDSDNYLSFAKLLEKGRKLLDEGNDEFINAEIDPEVMNILLFTSGTTADAKAVMLSHKNICKNLEAMCSMLYIGPDDVFLSVLPLHHTYECTCGFLCQVYRGCTIAQCEGLRHIVNNLKESKATIMLTVPLMLESIHKKIYSPANLPKLKKGIKISNFLRKFGIDLRRKIFAKVHDTFGGNLRLLISGGAAIDPEIIKGIQDLGIHCVQGYGLTECAPILALNRDVYYKNESAGIPLPGTDVKIIDKDENGIGEIIGKGDNVMLGYYENEEATREAIVDGYFHTGDLGYIDKDGFVIITGRKKNVIVTSNGKNIFPEEIENLLGRSDYIIESVVYGKNVGGDTTVVAEIFPDMDKLKADFGNDVPDDKVREIIGDVVKNVNHQLVSYKYIKEFSIRDTEFEKTSSRKIKRSNVGVKK